MEKYLACHCCDLLHRVRPLPPGGVALCSRCGAVLYRYKSNPLDRPLALAVTGMILFVIANSFPFLAIERAGLAREMTLITGIVELYREKVYLVAFLVLVTTLIVPFLELCSLLYIFVPLRLGRRPKRLALVWRGLTGVRAWSMMEVFMLGILVSLVKLAGMATIVPGIAVYAFGALILVLTAAFSAIDPHLVWEALEPPCR